MKHTEAPATQLDIVKKSRATEGVSFAAYKKALGPAADKLSDEQIQQRYDVSAKLAAALFDMWRKNLNKAGV